MNTRSPWVSCSDRTNSSQSAGTGPSRKTPAQQGPALAPRPWEPVRCRRTVRDYHQPRAKEEDACSAGAGARPPAARTCTSTPDRLRTTVNPGPPSPQRPRRIPAVHLRRLACAERTSVETGVTTVRTVVTRRKVDSLCVGKSAYRRTPDRLAQTETLQSYWGGSLVGADVACFVCRYSGTDDYVDSTVYSHAI